MRVYLLALIFACLAGHAGAAKSRCVSASVTKGAVAKHNGKWVELTRDQFEFVRGVFVMNPQTAAGLPIGDRAALVQIDGDKGGLIFFLDGDKACDPMAAPAELISMMNDVATDAPQHEKDGAL